MLDLASNKVGGQGAQALLSARHACAVNSPFCIRLSSNHIEHEGAKRLADALRNNQGISTLDLGGNRIGETGVEHLAAALLNNSVSLSLLCAPLSTASDIDTDNTRSVEQSASSGGRQVSHRCYPIHDRRFHSFLFAFATSFCSQALTSLDLSYNEAGNIGTKDLAAMLMTNTVRRRSLPRADRYTDLFT